jgi:proline dehydrogenase
MPGESVEAALAEAGALAGRGIGTLLTRLGENVTAASQAEEACRHYLDVIQTISQRVLDAELSVKLTHLGLDVGASDAGHRLLRLARAAREQGRLVWIDMEQSRYVDPTLEIYRRTQEECGNVGVCLQAYLYRTPSDVESLKALTPNIRLVKGAYREPHSLACPRRRDVDAAYLRLARQLMLESGRNGGRIGIATHDGRIIAQTTALARELNVPRQAVEYEMLYGINRGGQRKLAGEGYPVRVLISYGEQWFPWYVRRLAERPANVMFLLRNS